MTTADEPTLNDSIRGPLLAGTAVVLLFFGGLGSWAALAPMASAVIARGELIVEGNRLPVQHLYGGTVGELYVGEGDFVEAGQVLLRLDDTDLRAQVEILQNQVWDLLARQARLTAERDEADEPTFPESLLSEQDTPYVKRAIEEEQALFRAQKALMAGQIRQLTQQIADLELQISARKERKAAQERQLEYITKELSYHSDLKTKGFAAEAEVLRMKRSRASLEAMASESDSVVAEATEQLNVAKSQLSQLRDEHLLQVSDELRQVQTKLGDLRPRLKAMQSRLERTDLRAPISGYVLNPEVSGAGSVLGGGELAMEIVPSGLPMVVDAKVSPDDIENLKAGMPAEVSLTGFNRRVMPSFDGEVVTVSADRISDERTGQPYFLARITINQEQLAEQDIALTPGMPAQAMIPITDRTFLDYIVGPLTESIDRSFREQ